tara:strand:- start:517 stop:993 length:477 start_codon:yes stop_codon:yes gene_type:complete
MILSYILILISGIGLNMIGFNHYLDLKLFNMGIIKLDLFISMIFIATQTLVMFFFVGTGVSIKEYIQENPGTNHSFHQDSLKIKRKLYPPTMALTLLFVGMIIMHGLFIIKQAREFWFHITYIATYYYFIKSTVIQHKCFKENTLIILNMTGLNNKTN